ncbi:MAG: hypothetical protein ACP5GD_00345 [Candidatus Micrarchaeia archaeon]
MYSGQVVHHRRNLQFVETLAKAIQRKVGESYVLEIENKESKISFKNTGIDVVYITDNEADIIFPNALIVDKVREIADAIKTVAVAKQAEVRIIRNREVEARDALELNVPLNYDQIILKVKR